MCGDETPRLNRGRANPPPVPIVSLDECVSNREELQLTARTRPVACPQGVHCGLEELRPWPIDAPSLEGAQMSQRRHCEERSDEAIPQLPDGPPRAVGPLSR